MRIIIILELNRHLKQFNTFFYKIQVLFNRGWIIFLLEKVNISPFDIILKELYINTFFYNFYK